MLPEWRTAVREAARVTRPEGRIVVVLGGSTGRMSKPARVRQFFTACMPAGSLPDGENNGLGSVEDLTREMRANGFGRVVREVVELTRHVAVDDVIEQTRLNPFGWSVTVCESELEAAAVSTRVWATRTFGDIHKVTSTVTVVESSRMHRQNLRDATAGSGVIVHVRVRRCGATSTGAGLLEPRTRCPGPTSVPCLLRPCHRRDAGKPDERPRPPLVQSRTASTRPFPRRTTDVAAHSVRDERDENGPAAGATGP